MRADFAYEWLISITDALSLKHGKFQLSVIQNRGASKKRWFSNHSQMKLQPQVRQRINFS